LFLLCFWLSSLPFSSVYLFVFVSRPLIFIRGQGAERATIHVQSWRKGRVAGRSLCIHHRAAHMAFLLCLFHHSGRSWGGCGWCRGFWARGGGERER
jgi:hypothetical protein